MTNQEKTKNQGCFIPGPDGFCSRITGGENNPQCPAGDPRRCLDSPFRDPKLPRGEVGGLPEIVDGGSMRH